jgi:hypothetical protein
MLPAMTIAKAFSGLALQSSLTFVSKPFRCERPRRHQAPMTVKLSATSVCVDLDSHSGRFAPAGHSGFLILQYVPRRRNFWFRMDTTFGLYGGER